MVLEKTLESPLDCKEIQPVHSKGDRSWVLFGRNDAKAETPVLLRVLMITNKFNFLMRTTAAAKSRQSCPTLCDPIDGSPTGSFVPGILQARMLESVAISFSNA